MNITNKMTRRGIVAGLAATLVAPIVLVAQPAQAQRDRYDRGDRYDRSDRYDRRYRRDDLTNRGQWVRLGHKEVDGRRDRDTIHVDNRGRFRALMFRVTDSSARIRDVVVHFDNGQRFSPRSVEGAYYRGERSHVIDLPGNRRDLDSVTFRYSDLRGGRDADVILYGLR